MSKRLNRIFTFAFLAFCVILLAIISDLKINRRPNVRKMFNRISGEETLQSLSFQCHNSKPQVKQISKPYPATVVQTCGNIINRIRQFNAALDSIRMHVLKTHPKTTEWNISSAGSLTLLAEWKEDYFQALSNFSQVTLVILPWVRNQHENASTWSSLKDDSNLPINQYYESSGSDLLCSWIETPGQVAFRYDLINNFTCNRNSTKAVLPKSASLLSLNAKAIFEKYYYPSAFPEYFLTELPSVLYWLHIVESGVISAIGDVFIKNARLVPSSCFPDLRLNPPERVHTFPIYEEVLVMTQTFSHSHYHRLAETFPRIAVPFDFLMSNPNIRIHVPENYQPIVQFLNMLGVNASRIVHGWCRAEIVYLPRATMCCFPNFIETQIVSRLFRRYAKRTFAPSVRNKVVVIRRSKTRAFHNHTAVESVVKQAAMDFNLSFEVFMDNPAPPISDLVRLFNLAVMVVAPHGAGLANLVFSEPGTFVIEGVCNRPATNLFFQRTSLVLGHRYHAIAPVANGCHLTSTALTGPVIINPAVINETVRTYLHLLSARNFTVDPSAELPLLHGKT